MEIQLSARFKTQVLLILFAIVLVIAFGATIAFAAPVCSDSVCNSKIPDRVLVAVATPLCKYPNCHGKDPNTMGCGGDAVYGASIKKLYTGTTWIGEVHNRTSSACVAQWERTRNLATTAYYAEGSIRWGGSTYNSGWQPVSSPSTIGNGAVVYTKMYGNGGAGAPSLVCGNLSTAGPISPPSAPPSSASGTYKTSKCQAN